MNNNLIGIEYNKQYNYRVYHSPLVVEYQTEFISQSKFAYDLYCERFGDTDSTWGHLKYNIFGLTIGSPHFYALAKQITAACRDWAQDDERMWLQAWINYHYPCEVLKWHNHGNSTLHGYVSIDPKNTSTEFRDFSIKNEIGKIYVGPCGLEHNVVVHETFTTPRITLAFQAINAKDFNTVTKNRSREDWTELQISNILV
jgi:hypothetical protein